MSPRWAISTLIERLLEDETSEGPLAMGSRGMYHLSPFFKGQIALDKVEAYFTRSGFE